MARDRGLEALVNDELADWPGITQKGMFGGWVWLQHGNLLCGARTDGLLVRLGDGNDAWALAVPGIERMMSGSRLMRGWIRADGAAYGNAVTLKRLIESALTFVHTLPRK